MPLQEHKELSKLININKDACTFYEAATEHAKDTHFKRTFEDLRSLHSDVIKTLQDHVRAHGDIPEVKETISGKAQQFWGEVMVSVSNDVDETLVHHLEEAEDRCLSSMQEILERPDITPSTQRVLKSEYSALEKSHDYMKALKDTMNAA